MKRARKGHLMTASLIRRLCLSLLLLFGGWVSLPVYAQKAITLDLINQPFSTFIKQVEQQTDYKFFFEEQSVDVNRLVNVRVQNQDVRVVLNKILSGTNITYTIVNKKILLKKQENSKGEGTSERNSGKCSRRRWNPTDRGQYSSQRKSGWYNNQR